MLSFLSNTRVYLAAGATDLRKSFDTLAGVVRDSLSLDPLSGHLFVFMLPVRWASLPPVVSWLRAWLFGDSAGKIQQPDRLQKSG